jgi:antitoxin CcdA
MRMPKKQLRESSKRFRSTKPAKHDSHIRSGPKPGPKRAVNVSIDAAILKVAKDMKLNLSQVLEDSLRKITEPERIRRWQAENKDALASYDKLIERAGVFGEELLDLDEPAV